MSKEMDQTFFDSVPEADIRTALRHAQNSIWKHDHELLLNDASERSICGRLAFYLIECFSRFDIDLEYNRNRADERYMKRIYDTEVARLILETRNAQNIDRRLERIDEEGLIVWPDIIVHIRDAPFNLLVLEAKKSSSRVPEDVDQKKLGALKEGLGYRFAAFVKFPVGALAERGDVNDADWFQLQ